MSENTDNLPVPEKQAAAFAAVPVPRCMHLCCKAMLVYGEAFEQDPDYQAGMTDFWCDRTQRPCGPDNGNISLELCSNPQRNCYQAY